MGKTPLATQFATTEYKSFICIDFAIAPKAVRELFSNISDLDYLFMQLQLVYSTTFYEG